jgi:hypothetical protein
VPAAPKPTVPPPPAVEAPAAKLDFNTDDIAREVLAAFDDIYSEAAPEVSTEAAKPSAPKSAEYEAVAAANPIEEIVFEAPALDDFPTPELDTQPTETTLGEAFDAFSTELGAELSPEMSVELEGELEPFAETPATEIATPEIPKAEIPKAEIKTKQPVEPPPALELALVEPDADVDSDAVQQELFLMQPAATPKPVQEKSAPLAPPAQEEEIAAAPPPTVVYEEEEISAAPPPAEPVKEESSFDFLRRAESMLEETLEEITLEELSPADAELSLDSAAEEIAQEIVGAEPPGEDTSAEEISFEAGPADPDAPMSVDFESSADAAPELVDAVSVEGESIEAEPVAEEVEATIPTTEVIEAAEGLSLLEETAAAPLMLEESDSSDMILERAEPPKTDAELSGGLSSGGSLGESIELSVDFSDAAPLSVSDSPIGEDSSDMILERAEPPTPSTEVSGTTSRFGESIELEVDFSDAPPLSTSDLSIGDLDLAPAEPVAAAPASKADAPAKEAKPKKQKLELSIADGPITPTEPAPAAAVVTDMAPAPTPAPEPTAKAAAPAKAKPAKAETTAAAPTTAVIPVLNDVAVPPPQAALPIPPSPDTVRETAVRVIAKLNIELRKAGEKPLSAKTVMRLQQLLHEAMEKKNAEKKAETNSADVKS